MKQKTHVNWTAEQIARMEEIIDQAQSFKKTKVNWTPYLNELGGHTLSAVRSAAAKIYERRRDKIRKAQNRALRLLANTAPDQHSPRPAPKPPSAAKPISFDSHRISTSTGPLAHAAEMRSRFQGVSITAGQFGDPPPGRSALDEKLASLSR